MTQFKTYEYINCTLLLILCFEFFKFFPFIKYAYHLAIFIIFFWLILSLLRKVIANKKINRVEIYIYTLIFLFAPLVAFRSYITHPQSFSESLFAVSFFVLCGLQIVVANLIGKNYDARDAFIKSIFLIAILSIILKLSSIFAFNYIDLEQIPGFVVGMNDDREIYIPFDFVVLSIFILINLYIDIPKKKYLIELFICVVYLLFFGGRGLSLTLFIAVIFNLIYRKAITLNVVLYKLIPACLLLFFVMYFSFVNYEPVQLKINKFLDAVSVVYNMEDVDDISASARLMQLQHVRLETLMEMLIGNGIRSSAIVDPTNLDDYFHPSDLGLIGLLHTFGIFGIAFLAIPFLFIVLKYRRMTTNKDYISNSMFFYVIYVAVNSTFTGSFAFHPLQILLPLALL